MFDLLFVRTFVIVGGMLLITSVTAKANKIFETSLEMILTFVGTIILLFSILFFSDVYPLNLVLVAAFSGLIGWEIGPTIEFYGRRYKFRRHLKSKGIVLKKGENASPEDVAEFQQSFDEQAYAQEWHNIVFQALFGTALAVFSTAGLVFLTSIDFSFLEGFLFMALFILIIMGLLNIFIFRSQILSLFKAYIGAIIFTLYLLFDFNRLEKMTGDKTWAAAIDIAVNIYLDIINLFMDLLEILSED